VIYSKHTAVLGLSRSSFAYLLPMTRTFGHGEAQTKEKGISKSSGTATKRMPGSDTPFSDLPPPSCQLRENPQRREIGTRETDSAGRLLTLMSLQSSAAEVDKGLYLRPLMPRGSRDGNSGSLMPRGPSVPPISRTVRSISLERGIRGPTYCPFEYVGRRRCTSV